MVTGILSPTSSAFRIAILYENQWEGEQPLITRSLSIGSQLTLGIPQG
jgi:hypothetical protein